VILKHIITSIKFSVAIAGICLKDSYVYLNNVRFEPDVLKNSSLFGGGESLWQQKILAILKTFPWLHVGHNLRSTNFFCSTITITLLNLVCLP
jgi:hypothetical protein